MPGRYGKQKGYTIIELMISIAFIGFVLVVVPVGYIAFHFIAKAW